MNNNAEASYNLGVICIIKGKYDKAVQEIGGGTFNAGLAQLLNGNTEDAVNTLNSIKANNVKAAEGYLYYLKAVAAARAGDANGVFNNLQTAVQKDASLKAYAKDDLEFRDYFDNETFKSIVQ